MKNKIMKPRHHAGFTLLEILIALFIFSILSVMLTTALRNVINLSGRTEEKAERLRNLQMVLLMMSRDVEQAVNRPILDASGHAEAAFVGTPQSFVFTHMGFANPTGIIARSTLQRTGYVFRDEALYRVTWPVLDQTSETKAHSRQLLSGLVEAHFQYLDKDGRFQDQWPLDSGEDQPLPRGVRIYLTIDGWGRMSQFYVIAAEGGQTPLPLTMPDGVRDKSAEDKKVKEKEID